MAITFKSISTIEGGTNTFSLDATAEYVQLCTHAIKNTATAGFTITAYSVTDGTNSINLFSRLIQRTETRTSSGIPMLIAIAGFKPSEGSPGTLSGTVTLNITFSAAANAGGPDTFALQLDMGTSASSPYRGMAGTGIWSDAGSDPFTAFSDLALESGGFAVAFAARAGGTMTVAGSSTGGTWVQTDDTTFGGLRASVQYKDVTANYTETALALNPSVSTTHLGYFFWLKEVNDPSLTDVDTLPATPGETMTLAGTALDVANAGVRVRMVSTPTAYDTLTSYSASSASAATAVMPSMLTEVPFTVGTSQTVEFISTLSGAASGVAFAGSTDVAAGYAVVELLAPNTTASESVAANFGVTPVDLDQLYYQTDSGNVVIAANGVPTAGPSYVAGTTLNAYLWDASASSGRWLGPILFQLTDDGTVVPGGGDGTAGRQIIGHIRSHIRGSIAPGI